MTSDVKRIQVKVVATSCGVCRGSGEGRGKAGQCTSCTGLGFKYILADEAQTNKIRRALEEAE